MEQYSSGLRGRSAKALGRDSPGARVRISLVPLAAIIIVAFSTVIFNNILEKILYR